MKYTITAEDIKAYQKAIATTVGLKGERELRLSLTANNLQVTTTSGSTILHLNLVVSGSADGEVWVDGLHLHKVSMLLPVGRELTVVGGDALTYQLPGCTPLDIPLAATHPEVPSFQSGDLRSPSMGDGVQVFEGVDLSGLNTRDKGPVNLSLKDYAVELYTRMSGNILRIQVPTAYKCPHPFATEVTHQTLFFMRKMKEATISYYQGTGAAYMGLVDTVLGMEMLVPITEAPSLEDMVSRLVALPTSYGVQVLQQDMLAALRWCELGNPTAVSISYTDPHRYIEMVEAGSAKDPTKVPFTQEEGADDEESLVVKPLAVETASYSPTALKDALLALPKATIKMVGKLMPPDADNNSSPPMLSLSHTDSGTTIDVFISPLV